MKVSEPHIARVLLSVVVLVLAGCSDSGKVAIITSTGQQQTVLSGRFEGYNAATSTSLTADPKQTAKAKGRLTALACSAPTIALYKLTSSGDRVEPAVTTATVANDGKFSIDLRKMKVAIKSNHPADAHMLVVSGCGDAVYMRPVTAILNQNVTAASSVVSYLLNTSPSLKQKMVDALKNNPQKVGSLIDPVSTSSSLDAAYDQILANTNLRSQFETVMGAQPTVLSDASPELTSVSIPSLATEQSPISLSADATHWSSNYGLSYEWLLDNVSFSSSAHTTLIPNGNSQGTHTIALRVGKSDGNGHVDTTQFFKVQSATITISNNVLPQAPAFTVTTPLVSGTIPISSRNLTVTLQTGAALANCETFSNLLLTENSVPPAATDVFPISCSQDLNQTVAFNLTSANDGAKTLHLWAIDALGVVSAASSTFTLQLDTQAPVATIAAIPALSNQTTKVITFTANDSGGVIDSFQCKLDTGAWASCSSPVSLSGLTQGSHTYSVRAYDSAGNVSVEDQKTWLVDLTAPVLSITSSPSALTNSLASSFSFSATDSGGAGFSQFTCSLDNAAATVCTSPLVSTLAAGNHTLKVQAFDAAGNASAIQTHSWTIDTASPTTTITSKPAALTNAPNASFSFSGADTGGGTVASFECQLDSGAYGACGSPKTYSALASSAHTFRVRAVDSVGNIGTAVSYTWTIDTTTPMASISAHPDDITNATTASFSFSATAPPSGSISSYECAIDGSSYSSCTSPRAYSSFAQGSHTFQVRSIDNNGNASTPSSFTWIVDLTNPVLTVSGQPTDPSSQNSGTFSFTATDTGGGTVAGYECSLDSASFATCSSPKVLSSLSEGSHTVVIRALDSAGNVSTLQSHSWVVDQTAPALSISSKPASITNSTSGNFSFSATDTSAISSYSCSVDSSAFATCVSPVSLSGLSGASHSFSVKATDAAGNTTNAVSHTWTVDLNPPTVSIASSPAAITNQTAATFSFTASDTGGGSIASSTCSLDGASFTACVSPISYSSLSSSSHAFSVKSTDTAGNVSTTVTHTWTIDTTAPTVTITTPASSGTIVAASSLATYVVSGACSENGVNVQITGSTTGSTACSSGAWSTSLNLSSLAEGSLSIQASQTDSASNTGISAARTFIKDSIAPSISLTEVAAIRGGATRAFDWTLTETNIAASTNFTLELFDGTSWSSVGTLAAVTGVNTARAYTLSSSTIPSVNTTAAAWRVKVTDAAGNQTTKTSSAMTIDSTLPTAASFQIAGGATSVALPYVAFALSASDTGSGLSLMRFSESSTFVDDSWQPYTSSGILSLSMVSGTKTVYVWVKDLAGNISTSPLSASVNLDYGTPPVLALTSPTDANTSYTTGVVVPIAWTCSSAQGLDTNAIAYIQYTVDDGVNFTTIATNLTNNDSATSGHYDWNLPSAISGQVFRIAIGCRSAAGVITNVTGKALNTAGAWEIWAGGLFPIRENITAFGAGNLNILSGTTTLAVDNNNNVFFTAGTRSIAINTVTVLMRVDSQTGKLTRVAGTFGLSADEGDLSGTDLTTKRLCSTAIIMGTSADHTELLISNCSRIYGYNTTTKVVRLYANLTSTPFSENIYYSRPWFLSKNKTLLYYSSSKIYSISLAAPGGTPVWIYGDGTAAVTVTVGAEGKLSPIKTSGTDASAIAQDMSLVSNADATRIWFGGTFTGPGSTGTNTWAQIDYDSATQKYYVTSDTFTSTSRAMNKCIPAEHDAYVYCHGRDGTNNLHRFDPATGTVSVNFKNVSHTTSLGSSQYYALATTPSGLYLANNNNVIGILSSDYSSLSILAGVKNHFIGEGLSKDQADFANIYEFDYSPITKVLVLKQEGNIRFYNYNVASPVIYSTTTQFSSVNASGLSTSHSGNAILQTDSFSRILKMSVTNIATATGTGPTAILSGATSGSSTYDYAASQGIPDGTSATNATSGASTYLLSGLSNGRTYQLTLAHTSGDAYFLGSQTSGLNDYFIYRVKASDSKVYKVAGTVGAVGYSATGASGTLASATTLKSVTMLQEISTGTYAGDLLIVDGNVLRRVSVATESTAPKVYDIVALTLATDYSSSTTFMDLFYDETSQVGGLGGTLGTGNLYYGRSTPTRQIRKWKAASDLLSATDTAYSLPGLTLSGTYKVVRTPDGLLVIEALKSRILRLPP